MIAGIDFSSHAIDVVLLDEDSDEAEWRRFALTGQDAFDRARDVRESFYTLGWWRDSPVLAIGIEQPRGNFGVTPLMRIQGAILACIPPEILVQPWNPSSWRTGVGLKGNATKVEVAVFVTRTAPFGMVGGWPQDACDAFCIALATRTLLHHEAAA